MVAHGGTLMSVLSAFAVPEKPFYDWQVKNGRGFLLEVPEDFPEKRVTHGSGIFVKKRTYG